jgi:hypothetical protein
MLFIVGAALFALGAWGTWRGYGTLAWPRAQATIVDARLTFHETRRDFDRPEGWNGFAVRYVYTVEGRERLGGGLEPFDFNMRNSAGARRMQERFPVGATAPVAYDPRDPSVSYLIPGPSSFALLLLALGVIVALAGGLARRMIRVGPAHEDDAPATAGTALDPEIASYYRKPERPQP